MRRHTRNAISLPAWAQSIPKRMGIVAREDPCLRAWRPAGFLERLEDRTHLSLVVDLRMPDGSKSAAVTSVGQEIAIDVWGVVRGQNASVQDDGLQSAEGSFLSEGVLGPGAASGDLSASNVSPFDGLASHPGTITDLNGDGNLDIGSNNPSAVDDLFVARAGSMTFNGIVRGGAKEFLIAQLTCTITALHNGTTAINFIPRTDLGALWQEDGAIATSNGGGFMAGAPLLLTYPSAITVFPFTPPANDSFAAAAAIFGGAAAVNGSTVGATSEAGEPAHAGSPAAHSAWWTWTAPFSRRIALNTIGSSFDTRLAVYSGNSVSALTPLASDDNSGGNGASKLTFLAVAGRTYRFAVDGRNGATGAVALNLLTLPAEAPTAALAQKTIAAPRSGAKTMKVTVIFNDDNRIKASSIDLNDLIIIGRKCTLKAIKATRPKRDAGKVSVTYTFAAQNGAWGTSAPGTYAIWLQKKQVADVDGLFAARQKLGTFTVKALKRRN